MEFGQQPYDSNEMGSDPKMARVNVGEEFGRHITWSASSGIAVTSWGKWSASIIQPTSIALSWIIIHSQILVLFDSSTAVCLAFWHHKRTEVRSQDGKMQSTNDVSLMTSLGLKSNITTASADKTFYYQRDLDTYDGSKPILVLIHGYPQTWVLMSQWSEEFMLTPTGILC